MNAMAPSWADIATLEHQIYHELLHILCPNETIKPLSGTATTLTLSENDFSDIDEASVILDELLVDMKSTLDDAYQ